MTMKEYETIEMATEAYMDYIDEHIENVKRAWKELNEKLEGYFFDFIFDDWKNAMCTVAINKHDLSKYTKEEFEPYRMKFFPVKGQTYNPDSFAEAWEHHERVNPHHWQRRVNRDFGYFLGTVHIVENICD